MFRHLSRLVSIRPVSVRIGQRGRVAIANSTIQHVVSSAHGSCYSTVITRHENEDVLSEQMRKSDTIERALELIENHHKHMSTKHLLASAETLFQLKRISETKNEKVSISTNPSFRSFCNKLLLNARFFDPTDLVNLIKCMSFLGVSNKTTLMHSFYQLIRLGINDLSLHQIMYLSYLIEKQEPIPLTEALKIALPLVFESQLSLQMVGSTPAQLAKYLQYGANHNLSKQGIQKIVHAILNTKEPLSFSVAYNCFWGLDAVTSTIDGGDVLFQNVYSVLIAELQKLSTKNVTSMLGKCRNRKNLFNGEFVDAVCKRAVAEKWVLSDVHQLVQYLSEEKYVNLPILDRYSVLLAQDENDLKKYVGSLTRPIDAFTVAGYRPKNANKMFKALIDSTDERTLNLLKVNAPHLLMKTAFQLILYDYTDNKIVETVYNPEFARAILQEVRYDRLMTNLQDMLLLEQASKTLPGFKYKFSSVTTANMEQLRSQLYSEMSKYRIDYFLKGALEKATGGPTFVLNGVYTKFGVHIDYLIVTKENKPVPIASSAASEEKEEGLVFIEDIAAKNEGAKCIPILVFDNSCYATNVQKLQSKQLFKMMLLNSSGYSSVEISTKTWNGTPDYEKISFLNREIQESGSKQYKFDKNSFTVASVMQ